jgi:hypothetical protein
VIIKPQKEGRIERASVSGNKLEIGYEGISPKEPIKMISTVARAFNM